MSKIKNRFKVSLLLILLIIFNSIYIDAAPATSIGDNSNIAPTIDLNVTPVKKPVDIVILTDYSGTKLTALNTQINALKAKFSAVNVDPVFHIVSDVKKIGTQNDELYKFVRYGRYHAKISYYSETGEKTRKNVWFEEKTVWERTEGLASAYNSLPKRNPQNVTFVRGPLEERDTDHSYRSWWDITINCTNDVNLSGSVSMEEEYYNYGNGNSRYKQDIIDEYAEVDSKWTYNEKISDVYFDIYSLDFDVLNNITLRPDSDRHMIFLSDAAEKDYSKELGNYFTFGDMTDTFKDYIKTNKFHLYGVVDKYAQDRTLYPDKVAEILPLGDSTLYYFQNGNISQTDPTGLLKADELNINDIKDIVKTNKRPYLLLKDGTIKYYDIETRKLVNLSELTNILKLYVFGYPNQKYLYALDINGKVYEINGSNHLCTSYNNSVVITDIVAAGYDFPIFLTSTGVPYVQYTRYDSYLDKSTGYLLRRLQIVTIDEETGTETLTPMPQIKDAGFFNARAQINELWPMVFLHKSGRIQQFSNTKYYTTFSGTNDRYENFGKFLVYEPNSIDETGVKTIESCNTGIFVYKTDGSVRLINCNYVEETGRIKDDGDYYYFTYMRPYLKNYTEDTILSNIVKTKRTAGYYYFLTDSNNNTYMYNGTYEGLIPIIGTTLTNCGKVKRIEEICYSIYRYIFILYDNGTIRQIIYHDTSNTTHTNKLLSYNEIKDIYTSVDTVYLLRENGYVLGMGRANHGQLGKAISYNNNFIDTLETNCTFDETKTYYSLLDIFNEIANSKFYSKGGYATAFNDIYKSYNYSTSGNMYVVLGDDIKYESAYSDRESDPEYSRKWLISHEPYYFDNSMGLSAYHKPAGFTASPPVKLDKVGKYIINLKARDNPKSNLKFLSDSNEEKNYYKWSLGNHNLTVYVHRKPVARQSIDVTRNGDGTFTVRAYDGGSYDPDHNITRADKGITAREWRWREETSTVWTTGQMNKSDCVPDESYITQLRVKDVEGVWSDYDTITIDKKNPPIALFNIDKSIINISELLKVKDESYPQSLSDINRWHWIVKKLNANGSVPSENIQNAQYENSNAGTGALAGYDVNVRRNYSSNGTGKYRIYLRVKDSNDLWSDGGTNSNTPADLNKYFSMDFEVDRTPIARFTIEKNPIFVEETLKLKDQSTALGTSPLVKWHWIVKRLNDDGSVPAANIQDEKFTDSNSGNGEMEGYDVNIKTLYADKGPGTYRIYLRVMNGNSMWSDGGTESSYNLGSMYFEDLEVQESFKMSNFRVVLIRDYHLEPYYNVNGKYPDKPMNVNSMAIDPENFIVGGINIVPGFSGLTKGYRFEFEIDTINFNKDTDTIEIKPAFYPYYSGVPGTRGSEADLYWEDSNKNIYKAGEGGHLRWASITLDSSNRTITGENEGTWRGEYFIPATSWLTPLGSSEANAKSVKLDTDIIVNFDIKGYSDGVMKYDYNIQQWPVERTTIKHPYEIGDVIRYDHTKSCLDDEKTIINRP